ncbi:MAG: ABC transporter permease [Vicinamibacteria bacterium]|nr:ABC transporter permease [Vicinamibacteria bacterium]
MSDQNLAAFARDVRFALRQLRRDRAFALAAIFTLSLGIGATTALFSVLQAVVLNPLPFPGSEQLIDIATTSQGEPGAISAGNYYVIRTGSRTLAGVAARSGATFNLTGDGDPERVPGARVTASYFKVLGIEPELGRPFTDSDESSANTRVVILSRRLFTRRFAADPAIIGRTILLSGSPYEVLGVMPETFRIPEDPAELWTPLGLTEAGASFDASYLSVVARLKDGVTDSGLAADIAALNRAILEAAPRDNEGRSLVANRLLDQIVGDYRPRLFLLLGAVSLVFLIACVNVAGLLMARGAARHREIAVRAALGAGRARLARQLMTEALVLCAMGTLGGIALSAAALPVFVSQSPAGVPRLAEAAISAPVLVATAVLALIATLLAGIAPALRESRADLTAGAAQNSRGSVGGVRDSVRQAFVAAETALALMLLMGAGLLIRSASNLERVSPGFDPQGLLTARVALPVSAYPGEEKPAAAAARMVEALASRPGVAEAAASTRPPLIGDVDYGLRIEGREPVPKNRINARMQLVTPGYLETLRVPLRAGRTFSDADLRSAPRVMIVSETLARLAWPGENPIGKRIACCEGRPDAPVWKEVIGVVADTKARGLQTPGFAEFYLPMDQAPSRSFEANGGSITLVARSSSANPAALAPLVRDAVRQVDPGLPLYDVATMQSRVAASSALMRFNRFLLSCLGLVGLALAAIGIYGVIAYLAGQRSREIGVRMALGARPVDVVRLVLSQGLAAVSVGLVLGGIGAFAQGQAVEALLFGVSGRDPGTFVAVAGVLALAAFGASMLPAMRAARIDPAKTLAEP